MCNILSHKKSNFSIYDPNTPHVHIRLWEWFSYFLVKVRLGGVAFSTYMWGNLKILEIYLCKESKLGNHVGSKWWFNMSMIHVLQWSSFKIKNIGQVVIMLEKEPILSLTKNNVYLRGHFIYFPLLFLLNFFSSFLFTKIFF